MKRYIFLIVMLIFWLNINAAKINQKIEQLYEIIDSSNVIICNNTKTINEHTKNIEFIYNLFEKQGELIEKEQSVIEKSLNATSLRLDIFAIIIAIISIFLSVYINRKEKIMQGLLADVKEIEQKISKTKAEILNLNEMINNDIEGIYERLKREETITYLKRLVYEPNDIFNLIKMLVSRELNINDFKYLLLAYKKFKENSVNEDELIRTQSQSLYLIVFYQHFCGQSITHDLVREDLICAFSSMMDSAFKKDVCNATHSLINCLNKDASHLDRTDILYKYIVSLFNSKFRTYEEPYKIVVTTYKYDSELKIVWSRLVENKYISDILANLLCERLHDEEVFVKTIKETLNSNIK